MVGRWCWNVGVRDSRIAAAPPPPDSRIPDPAFPHPSLDLRSDLTPPATRAGRRMHPCLTGSNPPPSSSRSAASPLSIETGKLAKQADGAAVVRYGDTVVLVTVSTGDAARGDRLLPAHRRLRREVLGGRQDPGRLLQARGAALGPRDPGLPLHRSRLPAALRRRLPRRDADHRDRARRRRRERRPTSPPSSAPRRRSRSRTSRSSARSPRCASAARRPARREPDRRRSARRATSTWSSPAAAQALVMVEGGAKQLPEAEILDALQRAPPRDPAADRPAGGARRAASARPKRSVSRARRGRPSCARKVRAAAEAGLREALADPREARPLRRARRGREARGRAVHRALPDARRSPSTASRPSRRAATACAGSPSTVKDELHELRSDADARAAARRRRAHRRPRPDGHPADRLRGARGAPRPRLGALHARRDAGAGLHHARQPGRRADASTP